MRNVGCLVRRSGVFYFRKAIPHPLRSWAGCSEFVKSLHTRDPKLAARRALDMAEQLEAILGKIRLGAKLLSQAELGALSAHVTSIKTKALLIDALESYADRNGEDAEWEAFHARAYRQETLEDLRLSRLGAATDPVKALLAEHDLNLDEASAAFRQLCRGWLQGLADYYRNAELIARGQLEHPSLSFEASNPTRMEVLGNAEELSLLDVARKFLEDRRAGSDEKQNLSRLAKLNYFVSFTEEILGKEKARLQLSDVSSALARRFKEHLQKAPSNASKKYPGRSPVQAAQKAEEDGAPQLSQASQTNYLRVANALFNFAAEELDYAGPNPFKGRTTQRGNKGRLREKRDPLSREQLKILFRSPLFTGCKSLASCHRPGALIPKLSHRYWTPLIGLMTGMREQEILQLYAEDVYESSGIWCIDINSNQGDKRLKSPQSKRTIPVHDSLIGMGFLEFVGARKSGRLFPDAKLASDGTYSGNFSKWFSRYMTAVGIKTGTTSFHSLRHNMKDRFREAGSSDELAENFMGRSTGTVGESYGSGFSLKHYSEVLSRITFDDVL